MRECGQPLLGPSCYVATLDTRSFNPFKGYCICAECRNSSDEYQRLFPHQVLLHEPPDMVRKDTKRPNDLNCVYQTNQRNPGCCGKAECGEQLHDMCWIATNDPRSIHSLKNVYLCTECRNESDETKYMFSSELTLSNCSVSDNRKYFLINGDY